MMEVDRRMAALFAGIGLVCFAVLLKLDHEFWSCAALAATIFWGRYAWR